MAKRKYRIGQMVRFVTDKAGDIAKRYLGRCCEIVEFSDCSGPDEPHLYMVRFPNRKALQPLYEDELELVSRVK